MSRVTKKHTHQKTNHVVVREITSDFYFCRPSFEYKEKPICIFNLLELLRATTMSVRRQENKCKKGFKIFTHALKAKANCILHIQLFVPQPFIFCSKANSDKKLEMNVRL